MSIRFNNIDIEFDSVNVRTISKWLTKVIEDQNNKVGTVNYNFCSDEHLLTINQQFLQHDTYTDIITFDYSANLIVSGDIFISIDRVEDNALLYKTPFDQELHRVIVHGVLHLCGYKDKTNQEAAQMRKMEDHYLAHLS